jgi:hypothetical protein
MAKWYLASNVTPADPNSVQAQPDPGTYADLATGDKCFCLLDGKMRCFEYDSTSSATQDVPFVITSDGNSGNGRWLMEEMTTGDRFFHGVIGEKFDATASSDGATVTMSIEKQGGGDLTLIHPTRRWTLDCTPAATVTLTPGSDTSPTENYVYVLESSPTTLTVSTSDWPSSSTPHIKVSYFLVPSATYVQSHGCYITQNWNEGTKDGQIGHLAHMTEQMRLSMGGANWHEGVAGNGATDGYITIVTADTPDSAYFVSTSGECFQMHRHSVPAFNSQTEEMLVVNSNAGAYTPRNDIRDEEVDSTGTSLTNKYYNIVFWMAANKSGEYAPLMANMPSGSYTGLNNAINDVDGHDVYDIPREFINESATGFLVCRITFRQTASAITVHNTTDLRGRTPGTASGTAAAGVTEFADNQFNVYNVSDITKIVDFDLSGLTTGNTRTITPADADMKILSSTNHDDLTDLGLTDLHRHDELYETVDKVVGTAGGGLRLYHNTNSTRLRQDGTELSIANEVNESLVGIYGKDTSGFEKRIAYADLTPGNGQYELYFMGVKAAETTSNGFSIGQDNVQRGTLRIRGHATGTTQGGTLNMYLSDDHNSNSTYYYLQVQSGNFFMGNDDDGAYIKFIEHQAVELYYNGSKKAETTLTGFIADGLDTNNANEWTAQQGFNEAAITSSSNSVAWNLTTAQTAVHTMTENTTIAAPSNMQAGTTYMLRVVQAAGVYTLAFNAVFKWGAVAAPSAPAASGDVILLSFYSDGTNMYGVESIREEA